MPAEGAFTFTPAAEDERITFPDLKARVRGDAGSGEGAAAPTTGADPAIPPAAATGAADAAKN